MPATFIKFTACIIILACAVQGADAGTLYTASLRNGDYGAGFKVGTYVGSAAPWNRSGSSGGDLTTLGIVDSAAGATFTTPNDVINFSLGANGMDRAAFRTSGTVSVRFRADSANFNGGQPFVDNHGFTKFSYGLATFGTGMNRHAGTDGTLNTDDDRVSLGWSTLHSGTWYSHVNVTDIETLPDFDNWHHLGFTWGGSEHDFEVWVDGDLLASHDLPGSVSTRWGGDEAAYNFALGEIHQRAYGNDSPEGVTFADLEIWDEYRAQGNTVVPEPSTLAALGGLLGMVLIRFSRRRRSARDQTPRL